MRLPDKLVSWFHREKDHLIETALLWMALVLAERLVLAVSIPWLAQVVAIVANSLAPAQQAPAGQGALRRWLARMPVVCGVTIIITALLRYYFGLPWSVVIFFPIWIGALLITQFARTGSSYQLPQWLRAALFRQHNLLAGELALLSATFYLASAFYPGFWPQTWGPFALLICWVLSRQATGTVSLAATIQTDLLRTFIAMAALSALAFASFLLFNSKIALAHIVVFFWAAVLLLAYRFAVFRIRAWPDSPPEHIRWLFLGGIALFLLQGFARFTLHGTPDALWYGTMLADMVQQTRAGIFPVWVGQSEYQFNGAIYPLRVAPAFHYLGALLDTLTWHTLGIFALQNLLITLTGVAAIFSAYFSLASLLPRSRWIAAMLATLYLSCPGVLGIAYNTDLFMSWMTLPWVPLVWLATIRSFRDNGQRPTMLMLGVALGLCWWGHSPIALWLTILAGIAQGIRIGHDPLNGRSWLSAALGAIAFGLIAAYPIGSVLLFPPEADVHSASFQEATAGTIVHFLREVFPAVLLPLSENGRRLSDFQLGWSLWLLLLFILSQSRWGNLESRLFALGASIIAVLLSPVPGIDLPLWGLVPAFVRNTTGNWVMNRLYLVLASLVVFGVAARLQSRLKPESRHRMLVWLLAVGCCWSALEAAKYAKGSRLSARPAQSAVDQLRPENVLITRFAYLVFPGLPSWFTHGVMDPAIENRLLLAEKMTPFQSNYEAVQASAVEVARVNFAEAANHASNYLEGVRPLQLESGKHYFLTFEFVHPDATHGVLQFSGPSFFREYALPEYGNPRSFGIGGEHRSSITLETTSRRNEDVAIRFFPDPVPSRITDLIPLAQVTLFSYEPDKLPIRIESWLPYRARVSSPQAAWLETPRMFQNGYRARVDGRPAEIRKSPDGLVAVRVPVGLSHVEVDYVAPIGLKLLFWLSLLTIAASAARGGWHFCTTSEFSGGNFVT